MGTKSKKKSKTKSKTKAKKTPLQPAALQSAQTTDTASATSSKTKAVKQTTAITPSPAQFERSTLSELPMWQRVLVLSSMCILAGVSLYVVIAGVTQDPGSEANAKQVITNGTTPGGTKNIQVQDGTPLMQQTNPVQAAPAINSGSVNSTIQQNTGGSLQEQSSSLQ